MKKNREPKGLYFIDGGAVEIDYYIIANDMAEALEIHRAKAGEDPGKITCAGTEMRPGVFE